MVVYCRVLSVLLLIINRLYKLFFVYLRMEEFKLQAYTKADLAQLYSPHSQEATALQNLYRWMKRNQPLMSELEAIGYNKYRHSFLKREVGIIVKYLGEP